MCQLTGHFIQWRYRKHGAWNGQRDAVGDSWAVAAAAGSGEERPPPYQDLSRPSGTSAPSALALPLFQSLTFQLKLLSAVGWAPPGLPGSSPLALNQEDQLLGLSLQAGCLRCCCYHRWSRVNCSHPFSWLLNPPGPRYFQQSFKNFPINHLTESIDKGLAQSTCLANLRFTFVFQNFCCFLSSSGGYYRPATSCGLSLWLLVVSHKEVAFFLGRSAPILTRQLGAEIYPSCSCPRQAL